MERRYRDLLVLMATFIGNCAFLPTAWAQEPSSFYFTAPQPRGADFLSSVPKRWQGAYHSEKDTTLRLFVTNDSIYTEAPVAMLSSVSEARNNGHTVLDSVIVVDNDSLPCWIHNDTVYFFLYVKNVIYTKKNDQPLFEAGDFMLMNSKNEKNFWDVALLIHQGGAIELGYFDHARKEEELKTRKKIKKENEGNTTTYYASFKSKDWKSMYDDDWFPYKIRFTKNH